jgi:hypothetical protein
VTALFARPWHFERTLNQRVAGSIPARPIRETLREIGGVRASTDPRSTVELRLSPRAHEREFIAHALFSAVSLLMERPSDGGSDLLQGAVLETIRQVAIGSASLG